MEKFHLLTWLKLNVLPLVGAWLIRLLGRTLRIRYQGAEVLEDLGRRDQRAIFAFWHGRQLMMPVAYRGPGAYILISRHRDGELIHRIVSRLGFRSVRGSSTRGGAAALHHLIKLGRDRADLVVTPDGPKGPRGVAQPGVVHLAKATGLPIVPVTFSSSKKKSSRVGIGFWSRTRSAGRCSSSGNRSGWLKTPAKRTWSGPVWSCRRRSTG
jgi:lysophospholipid acyltransferase (LPLAT)-like uncharacterized protein